MKKAQEEYNSVGPVYKLVVGSGEKPSLGEVSHWSQESKILLISWSSLQVKDGLLYYHWIGENCKERDWLKLVVPEKYRGLEQLHNSKTGAYLEVYEKIKARYYWPGVSQYVKWWVGSCLTCQRYKQSGRKRGESCTSNSVLSFERVAMDIVGPLPQSDRGNLYILVICDYFTKFVEAFALPDQRAETVATAFLEGWVTRSSQEKCILIGVPTLSQKSLLGCAKFWESIKLGPPLGTQKVMGW